jgi:hypothetical protein
MKRGLASKWQDGETALCKRACVARAACHLQGSSSPGSQRLQCHSNILYIFNTSLGLILYSTVYFLLNPILYSSLRTLGALSGLDSWIAPVMRLIDYTRLMMYKVSIMTRQV